MSWSPGRTLGAFCFGAFMDLRFRGLGFRGLGFRGLGFLGVFRDLRLRVFGGVLGIWDLGP